MNIGKVIKKVRKEKKIKQYNLCIDCDISQTALSQIENGHAYPNPKTIKEICRALNISYFHLILLCIDDEDVKEDRLDIFKSLVDSLLKCLK